ncbi:MAG: hypothetical protein V4617_02035 [Gemmatimonadota bacterium]
MTPIQYQQLHALYLSVHAAISRAQETRAHAARLRAASRALRAGEPRQPVIQAAAHGRRSEYKPTVRRIPGTVLQRAAM